MNSIQEDYIAAKRKYDNAIMKVECHVRLALKKAGLSYSTAPMELLISLKAEGNEKFNVNMRRRILRHIEGRLLGWGWEYIRSLNVDSELDSSDTKLKTIRDSMIENFSKMER